MDKAKCRSCGAEIYWLRSATTNSLMPVDASPVPDGNIAIIDGVAHVRKGDLFECITLESERHKSHFATCPNAKTHRKGKK